MFSLETLDYDTRQKLFADKEAAREFIEEVRWAGTPVCPHCDHEGAYKLEPKPDSDSPVRPGVYKCSECRKQFTETVGTISEGTRLGLYKWLYALHLMCSSKKGHQRQPVFPRSRRAVQDGVVPVPPHPQGDGERAAALEAGRCGRGG